MTPVEALAKLREAREATPYGEIERAAMVLEVEHARLLKEGLRLAQEKEQAEEQAEERERKARAVADEAVAENTRLQSAHDDWRDAQAEILTLRAENTRLRASLETQALCVPAMHDAHGGCGVHDLEQTNTRLKLLLAEVESERDEWWKAALQSSHLTGTATQYDLVHANNAECHDCAALLALWTGKFPSASDNSALRQPEQPR